MCVQWFGRMDWGAWEALGAGSMQLCVGQAIGDVECMCCGYMCVMLCGVCKWCAPRGDCGQREASSPSATVGCASSVVREGL